MTESPRCARCGHDSRCFKCGPLEIPHMERMDRRPRAWIIDGRLSFVQPQKPKED
jgi:hypothetical protein